MYVAICDDEEECVIQLEKFLNIFKNTHRNVRWESFYSAEELLAYYEHNGNVFDVLITDIEMDKMNGVELANSIRNMDTGIVIIFLTGHDKYIRQCFKPSPLNFWDKPITYSKFETDMKEAIRRSDENRRTFGFKNDDTYKRIPYSEILYFSTSGKNINVHTLKATYSFSGSFKEYEQAWSSAGFIRISRFNFVNITFIDKFEADEQNLYLTTGEHIRVSRNNIKNIKTIFFENDLERLMNQLQHFEKIAEENYDV